MSWPRFSGNPGSRPKPFELRTLKLDGIIAKVSTRDDEAVLAKLGIPVINVSGQLATPRLPMLNTDDLRVEAALLVGGPPAADGAGGDAQKLGQVALAEAQLDAADGAEAEGGENLIGQLTGVR